MLCVEDIRVQRCDIHRQLHAAALTCTLLHWSTGNHAQDRGATELAAALKNCERLRDVELAGTDIIVMELNGVVV